MKKTKIKKMGNSHGIIIPKEILAKANITDHVILTADDKKITITPFENIDINQRLQDELKEVGLSILDNNIVSFNGLKLALNQEQISSLINQFINGRK